MKLALCLVLAAAACGGGGGDSSRPAPAAPSTGAPVAAVVDAVHAPNKLDVAVYDLGDRPIDVYDFRFRFYDASGAVLKVKVGTPFESDVGEMSVGGGSYKIWPHSWKTLTLDEVDVPAGAVRADALISRVVADGDAHTTWELPGDGWPGATAAR